MSLVCAHCQQIAPLGPLHGGDRLVVVGAQVAQLDHLAVACAPQVHRGAQPNRQHVLAGPVHQVQVEVVLQFGRVQDLENKL